jgi:calcium/calmodulin-dependent protein kinase I
VEEGNTAETNEKGVLSPARKFPLLFQVRLTSKSHKMCVIDFVYRSKDDTRPKRVIFVTGRYVEIKANAAMEKQNLFEFEMSTDNGGPKEKRSLFARNISECQKWVSELQRASCKVSIEQFYELGRELGKGKFSHVQEATNKVSLFEKNCHFTRYLCFKSTREKCAVKVIDKTQLGVTEKELLRTEIAILKLVKHPHIIRLQV